MFEFKVFYNAQQEIQDRTYLELSNVQNGNIFQLMDKNIPSYFIFLPWDSSLIE